MKFEDLKLIPPVLKALRDENYSVPTAIQATSIPLILNREDPAREAPIEGVTSELILKYVESKEKDLCTKEQAIERIDFDQTDVLMTLGAGDIDQLVAPISEQLNAMC